MVIQRSILRLFAAIAEEGEDAIIALAGKAADG